VELETNMEMDCLTSKSIETENKDLKEMLWVCLPMYICYAYTQRKVLAYQSSPEDTA